MEQDAIHPRQQAVHITHRGLLLSMINTQSNHVVRKWGETKMPFPRNGWRKALQAPGQNPVHDGSVSQCNVAAP